MRVVVDQDFCLGLGCCQRMCPDVFALNDGVASVKVKDVDPRFEDGCRDAQANCPVGAIWILHDLVRSASS